MTESTLIPLLQADQRERWQRGERTPVESYLNDRPGLHSDPEGLLDLIYHEMVLREESGDTPALPEYLQRFPQFSDEIRRLFEIHQVLEHDPLDDSLPTTRMDDPSAAAPVDATIKMPAGMAGYELLGELGRGGMGVVYKARQVGLKRLVALKMILAGAHAGPRELARLRAEAEAAARLHHPNITQIYAIEENEGRPFLSLELVDGVSLNEHISKQSLPPAQAAALVETVARAMQYAHEHGVIHRDLKPNNILMTADGTPKVTDFGLAKLVDDAVSHGAGITGPEALLGTPHYMAPEQARGRVKEIGPATDIYSLGAILYELLTGRPPFRGSTILETLDQVRHREPIPPRRVRPVVPRDLDTICLKCLEKTPARRYATAGELADDLRRFLNYEPIRARPASWWQRTAKWARRRPAAAALAIFSAAIVPAFVALVVVGHLNELERLARSRGNVESYAHAGREAFEQQDWAQATREFGMALKLIRGDPALGEAPEMLRTLHDEANRRLTEERARQQTEKTYRRFVAARDNAMFHGIAADAPDALATGMRADTQRTEFTASARQALALVACDPHGTDAWAPPAEFSDTQKAEVQTGCYTTLLLMADAAAKRSDSLEAMRLVERAEQLGTHTQAAAMLAAENLEQQGDAPRAAEARQRARKLGVTGALDAFLIGHAHLRQGDLRRAIPAFESAVAAQPNHFWAHCCLAICELREENWVNARLRLDVCLLQRPEFVWARLLRGLAAVRLGDIKAAELDFGEAQKTLEQSPNGRAQYVLYVNRADLHRRAGSLDSAARDLRDAIKLASGEYAAHLNLASVLFKQEHRAEAVEHFRKAVELKPTARDLARFHRIRGRDLVVAGRFDEAVTECRLSLKEQPGSTATLGVCAEALLKLRRFPEAAKMLDEYLARGGTETDAYRGRGQARIQLGDPLGAVEDYTQVVLRSPSSEIHAHRGWAYFFADAFRPAQRDFDTAVRLDRANTDAYIGRALAQVMLGKVAEAITDADEAQRRKPTTPDMMHNLACVYALAVTKIATDLKQPQREKLAAGYRATAMKLIHATLESNPAAERARFWRDVIAPDTAMDSLRDLAEFKQLGRMYGSAP
jgi:serine/threonine protein kinase/tetratricopeptide (TPR) repeat protein